MCSGATIPKKLTSLISDKLLLGQIRRPSPKASRYLLFIVYNTGMSAAGAVTRQAVVCCVQPPSRTRRKRRRTECQQLLFYLSTYRNITILCSEKEQKTRAAAWLRKQENSTLFVVCYSLTVRFFKLRRRISAVCSTIYQFCRKIINKHELKCLVLASVSTNLKVYN